MNLSTEGIVYIRFEEERWCREHTLIIKMFINTLIHMGTLINMSCYKYLNAQRYIWPYIKDTKEHPKNSFHGVYSFYCFLINSIRFY